MCIVPGVWSPDVHSALITHCELLRDRFAILDPPDGLGIEEIRDFRAPLDTKYAALYYPWVIVRDPVAATDVHDRALGAHGRHLRTGRQRPRRAQGAGQRDDSLASRASTADVNKREQDLLNPPISTRCASSPSRGNRVCGARCVTVGLRVEIRQRPPAVHLRREVDRTRHAVGGVRAERRAALGAGAAVDHQLPDHGLAQRRAAGRQGRRRRSSSSATARR